MLGTVDSPDGRQLTVADVPGLIEGASQGVGLGHEFLAHLERARLLVHVIDAAAGDPAEQFRQIDHELAEYGAGLDERRQAVVLNKVDLLPSPPSLERRGRADRRRVPVSAATGAGHRGASSGSCSSSVRRSRAGAGRPGRRSPSSSSTGRSRARQPTGSSAPTAGFRVTGDPPPAEELEAALRAAGARKGTEVEVGDETLVLSE